MAVVSKLKAILKPAFCAAAYASATRAGCQLSKPRFKKKPSMPADWASEMSDAQLDWAYGCVLPTMKCAQTYFWFPLTAIPPLLGAKEEGGDEPWLSQRCQDRLTHRQEKGLAKG